MIVSVSSSSSFFVLGVSVVSSWLILVRDDHPAPLEVPDRLQLFDWSVPIGGGLSLLQLLDEPLRVFQLEEEPVLADQEVSLHMGRDVDGEHLGRAQDRNLLLRAKRRIDVEDPEFVASGVCLRHGSPCGPRRSKEVAACKRERNENEEASQFLHRSSPSKGEAAATGAS